MKQPLLKTFFTRDNPLRAAWRKHRLGLRLIAWEAGGRPVPPPPEVKHGLIRSYAKRFGCRYLVETGTHRGDTVAASLESFDRIWSIELAHELAAESQRRFADQPCVRILEGDSARLLRTVIPQLDQPALFWLDGHYCGGVTAKGDVECPIFDELDAVFSGNPQRDVILIDDARCFVGEHDYPTITELREHVDASGHALQTYVADDVIRIHRME